MSCHTVVRPDLRHRSELALLCALRSFRQNLVQKPRTCGSPLPLEVVCPDYLANQVLSMQSRRCSKRHHETSRSTTAWGSSHSLLSPLVSLYMLSGSTWYSDFPLMSLAALDWKHISALCTKPHYPWGHSSLLWIGKRKEDDKEQQLPIVTALQVCKVFQQHDCH